MVKQESWILKITSRVFNQNSSNFPKDKHQLGKLLEFWFLQPKWHFFINQTMAFFYQHMDLLDCNGYPTIIIGAFMNSLIFDFLSSLHEFGGLRTDVFGALCHAILESGCFKCLFLKPFVLNASNVLRVQGQASRFPYQLGRSTCVFLF